MPWPERSLLSFELAVGAAAGYPLQAFKVPTSKLTMQRLQTLTAESWTDGAGHSAVTDHQPCWVRQRPVPGGCGHPGLQLTRPLLREAKCLLFEPSNGLNRPVAEALIQGSGLAAQGLQPNKNTT